MSRALALAVCLAAVAGAAAQTFSCASLPPNWGSDQDNNDNGPWTDLTSDPSAAVISQIWNTFTSRYGSKAIPNWTTCSASEMTNSSVGCQQSAGEGTNYALQVNFTCPSATTDGDEVTLGMTVDVNTYSSYINVDDMDVEFVAVNGEIVTGDLDEADWWESNDDVWGDFYSFDDQDNNDDQDDENNDNDNEYYQNQGEQQGLANAAAGEALGQQQAAVGQAVASGQISGEQAGEMFQENGEAAGEAFDDNNNDK
ncbi:expressed protein [Chlorella variabilis]|uniref:Expressed protein n=1 Tax=Chlorella variabilis TaxID=554065 RepID=E1Z252_CHLVA|nr:expressed protein [Chlorella variabilis]EFN59938.1 expressed protein [Chlorella variabilis]|eukprot:XP_005852040.1 expressed protein [Chlorella variabilis]